MKRWHEDLALMRTRSRSFLAEHRPGPLGAHRKRHPGDCGKAGCGLCHGDKHYGPKRRVNERRHAIQLELTL